VRRILITATVLLVVVLIADQLVRARIQQAVGEAVASGFAASAVDVDLAGALVLPQLLTGELDAVTIHLDDAVLDDPPVRLAALDATIEGVVVGFPPSLSLDQVEVSGGTARVVVHEREVERLLRQDRPDATAEVTAAGVIASATYQGVPVSVTAEPVVDGETLRFRAREVDIGALPASATGLVAGLFDTTIPLDGLPDGIQVTGAHTEADRLVIEARVVPGPLVLG
jgi:hypothetical protein